MWPVKMVIIDCCLFNESLAYFSLVCLSLACSVLFRLYHICLIEIYCLESDKMVSLMGLESFLFVWFWSIVYSIFNLKRI